MCHEALLIKTWLTLVINCTNLACSGLFGEIKDLTAKLFGANQRLCAGEIPTIFAFSQITIREKKRCQPPTA